MTVKQEITEALNAGLAPTALDVIDESHLHAGHGGWRESSETHFRVRVTSPAFNGKTRLDRHRVVNALLARQLREGVHALALETRASDDGDP